MWNFVASFQQKMHQTQYLCRVYTVHVKPLGLIWLNRFPPGRGNAFSLLEALVLTILLTLRLSLPLVYLLSWKKVERVTSSVVDFYVFFWLAFLAGSLFSWNLPPWYVVLLAGYRVYDILVYEFCVILVDSQKSDWSPISEARSLILAVFNLLTIAVAFAIAYLWSGQIATPNGHKLSSPAGAFYFSFMTMTTLGDQNFSPTGPWSKSIVVLHLFSSVLYVAVVIPIFVSVVTNALRRRSR